MRACLVLLWAVLPFVYSEKKMSSDRFRLRWYGPQSASYKQMEKPSLDNYVTKGLFIFDKITPILNAKATLKLQTDNALMNDISPGVNYMYTQLLVEGTALFELNVTQMKLDGQTVDFREFMLMEPEDNRALVDKYFTEDYTLYVVLFKDVPHQLRPPLDPRGALQTANMEMYLAYPFDSEERLTTKIFDPNQGIDVARPITFLLTDDPNMTAITPTLGPSQGGTEVAISGEGFETYTPPANKWGTDFPTHFHPLLRVTMATKVIDVEVDGYETEAVYYQRQHVDVQPGWSYDLLKARMPPQLLNETDITISVSMEISINRQNWFAAPGTFVVYDPSRIVYKQALTIAQLEHLNVLWAGAQRTTTGNGEHILLAVNEEARDTNKLWIPFPAHGVEDVTEGMPILCGSTVRLRHARTARNLHASSDDSPTVHQFNTGTYGINGHGNTGDDWVIECDNNFEHEYPYDWESFKWDKRFHSERYEFVRRNRNRFWHVGTPFKLHHVNSGKYLTFSGLNISQQHCPQCDSKELTAVTNSHSQSSNRQRWFVKDVVDVPVECPVLDGTTGEKLVKRWQVYARDIKVGDWVVWKARREQGRWHLVHPCESHGELRLGKVLQLVPDTTILTVSRFYLHQGKYKNTRIYQAPLDPELYTVPVSLAHGPLSNKVKISAISEVGSGLRFNPNVTRESSSLYIEFTKEHQELVT